MRFITTLAFGVALLATPALAQQSAPPMQGMDHSKMQGMDHSKMQGMDHANMPGMDHSKMSMAGGPAAPEYMAAMQRMHASMMQSMEGQESDPARAYAMMMIPHHQAAIDNSRTVLKHSRDAEIRRFAQKVITAQSKEIGDLQSFLRTHPSRAPAR